MRIRSPFPTALVLAALLPMAASAQDAASRTVPAAAPAEAIRDIDAVVVSGVVPGPGLWRVSRDGREMWVLGVLSPLPRRMEWEGRDVEAVVARASEVMLAPNVDVEADVGFFSGLALAPRLIGARRNPGDKRLEDLVPPADYARWQALKARYIGRDGGIERWRPMFAALKLYVEAVEDVGLESEPDVADRVERMARTHGVTLSKPGVEVRIDDPKAAIEEFKQGRIDDLACFTRTLDRLETDLGMMRERANAWAVGDIEGLRALPYTDQFEACRDAARSIEALRSRAGDIGGRLRAEWLREAERALSANTTTLALLPMRELLSDDGLVAALRERGYRIESPDEIAAAAAAQEAVEVSAEPVEAAEAAATAD
ncbi:TraB/GumN family protein [Marilutibacter aestuarii]|nr:TraB/GumN family protein [Lysobacter aestuarii]